MAAGTVRISDVVVPEIFNPTLQVLTMEKSAIIQSGAAVIDQKLNTDLAGAGSTFNNAYFKDLDNDGENTSSDDPNAFSAPNKIGSLTEVQVRISRNQSWASMDLVNDLIDRDPMQAILNRVAAYWARRHQLLFVNALKGVFADNDLAPAGTDTHTQYDMTYDASGAAFVDGVTNFKAEHFINACLTMQDAMEAITLIVVHSVVYATMLTNDLIDFQPDSTGSMTIATFMGKRVVMDDGMPFSNGVFESWLFGQGSVALGMGQPLVPTETIRVPSAGNGSGQEVMHSRVEWAIHPKGYVYVPSYTTGGPTNATLALAATWSRIYPERKQIRIARLKTREF